MTARWRHLINDAVQSSNDSVYSEELPNSGALHALLVKVRCTNGATGGRAVGILDVVDNIEIVDGSNQKLFTLIPEEVEKWTELLLGHALEAINTEVASGVQEMVFPLQFGRDFYDPEIYLPLGRFKQVKLECAFSPSIAADGGFTTGTVSFDIMALITPEDVNLPYRGTLVTRRIEQFTSAASGDKSVELPPDTTIRNVGVYAYEAAIEQGVDITRVQIRDTAKDIGYFDADWPDFVNVGYMGRNSLIRHAARLFLQDTDTWATRLGNIERYGLQVFEDVSIANDTFIVFRADTVAGDTLTFNSSLAKLTAASEDLTARATDDDVFAWAEGKGPGHFGIAPFGWHADPERWLKTADLSKPFVILTQGGADADVRVSIQELRTF